MKVGFFPSAKSICDLIVCMNLPPNPVPEKPWLSDDTQNQAALDGIRNLENAKAKLPGEVMDGAEFVQPVFISHLNNVECAEGETAKFQCQVQPANDPDLKIGKLIDRFQ